MRALLAACWLTLALALALPAHAQLSGVIWAQWEFLLGDWGATGSGPPGEATGRFSCTRELDGAILVRRNRADYAPKPGEKAGLSHEDLMIVYPPPGGGGFRAIYFDGEGHVIDYGVSFPEEQPAVILESDGPGPRFRLDYALKPDSTLAVTFSIAPPGQPFKIYTQGIARRMP